MATRSAATARCGPTGRPACAFPLAPRPGSCGICAGRGGGRRAGGIAARVYSTWSTSSRGGGTGIDSTESYFETVERRRVAEARAQEPPPPPPEDPFAAYRSVPSFWDTVGSPTADAPQPQQQRMQQEQQRDQERVRQQQEQQRMQQQRQEQQRMVQQQQPAARPASSSSDSAALVGGLEASGPVAAAMQALQGAYGGRPGPPPQPTPWASRQDAPSAASMGKHEEEEKEEEEKEEEEGGGSGGFFTAQFQAALQAALSRSDDEDPGPPAMPGPGPSSAAPAPTPLAPLRPADREVSKTVATLEEALAGSHMTLSRLQLVAGELKRLMEREKLQVQRLEFALEKAQADDAYYTTLRRMQEAGANSDWE